MSPLVSASQRDQYLHERREHILNASIQVFERKGFAGATVEDIASTVGISKGTIYRYFKNKEQLFTAILTERTFIPILADLVKDDQPLEVILRKIAESFLSYMDTHLPVVRIGLADAQRFPEGARQVYQTFVLKGNQALADFLEKQSDAGRIQHLDNPFLRARTFMGMLMFHVLTQDILGGKDITPIEREDWISEAVLVFLSGLAK